MRYKKSHWIYDFERNEDYAFFNANNLTVIFSDEELLSLLNQFREPKTLDEILKLQMTDQETLLYLIEKEFLVPEIIDEKNLFLKKGSDLKDQLTNVQIKETTLNAMRIILTERCNYSCSYCFVMGQTEQHEKRDMSREDLFNAVDFLIENNKGGQINLQFFGGEPLLKYSLIVECMEYVNNCISTERIKKVEYSIATNGSLLTDEICEYFKKNELLVNLSIDGPKELHDFGRIYPNGDGTYADTIRGLELLKKHGNKVAILLTPTTENVNHISEIFRFIVTELKCKEVTINTPQPTENGWPVDPVILSNQIKEALLIAKEHNALIHSPATRVLVGLNKREPQILSCARLENSEEVTVSPEGLISYCIITWHVKDCLVSINDIHNTDLFNEWKYIDSYGLEKCFNCAAINVCGGPCALEKYYERKSFRHDNDRCKFYQDFIKWAVWN